MQTSSLTKEGENYKPALIIMKWILHTQSQKDDEKVTWRWKMGLKRLVEIKPFWLYAQSILSNMFMSDHKVVSFMCCLEKQSCLCSATLIVLSHTWQCLQTCLPQPQQSLYTPTPPSKKKITVILCLSGRHKSNYIETPSLTWVSSLLFWSWKQSRFM